MADNTRGRRAFLQAGGVLVVALAGGGVWRGWQQGVFSVGQGPAYEPWRTWQEDMGQGPLSLVRAAILASNPHNSQPWLFRVGVDEIALFADTERQIGTIDPFLREMYTGLGCALENLLLAAEAEGYAATVRYRPDPSNPRHAASVFLDRGEPLASDLYAAIPRRHTNRLPYDVNRPVDPALLADLSALNDDPAVGLIWVTDPAARSHLGEQIVAATVALIGDEEQSRDSHVWWRANWQRLQAERDGIKPDAGQPAAMAALVKWLPDADRATADSFFLEQTRSQHTATAAGYGLITVRDAGDDEQRMRGGRLWQRLHLQATRDGLAMQPLNQLPERADRERQLGLEPVFTRVLADVVADPGFQALMPFRFGYPTQPPTAPAPRRPVEAVMAPPGPVM